MWQALLLTLLILVPIVAFLVARRRLPRHTFGIAGAAFGAIVAPWSLGLYMWFFFSPWGVVPGLPGLALVLLHGQPGFHLAVFLGAIPRGETVSGVSQHLVVEAINAVFWSVCYGGIGMGVDYLRRRNKNSGDSIPIKQK